MCGDSMKTTLSLNVKGMHCKSCAELIKLSLSKLHGVETVDASFPEERVTVSFNSDIISREEIKKELIRLDYLPSPPLQENSINTASVPEKENSLNAVSAPETSIKKENFIKEKSSLKEGIIYGLTPHIGCIGFIVASVLGVTVAVNLFKPLLMNPWFFHILMAISFVFATVSAMFYLKKNDILSMAGIARKKKYLATMYGSTAGINLLLFFVLFPMIANLDTGSFANSSSPTGAFTLTNQGNTNTNTVAVTESTSILVLQVDIPCPGHAPLISGELKSVSGVTGVKFNSPNYFDVAFDGEKTSKEEILSLDVFKTYPAKVVSESISNSIKVVELTETDSATNSSKTGTCKMSSGGGCGCGGCSAK